MLAGAPGSVFSRTKPIASGRIVDAVMLNAPDLVFALDRRPMLAVLDGDVVLEPSCYEVDADAGTIRLGRRPAQNVRLLVA